MKATAVAIMSVKLCRRICGSSKGKLAVGLERLLVKALITKDSFAVPE